MEQTGPQPVRKNRASKFSGQAAGILMYRRTPQLQVLLARPGGPYYRNKSEGIWTVPKGEINPQEDHLAAARREFQEETGYVIPEQTKFIPLGSFRNVSGKKENFIWGFEGDLPDSFVPTSNTFEMIWPPKSGAMARFPEIEELQFFSIDEARRMISESQTVLLDRLLDRLGPLAA